MNIERIGQFAYESFKKINDNKLLEKDDTSEKSKTVPAKDNFVKNDKISNYEGDIEQLAKFAKSLPDVREQKLQEINKKIADGFYSQPGFADALAEKLTALV